MLYKFRCYLHTIALETLNLMSMKSQIFVINIDRATHRLDSIKSQLDDLNLPFEKISAVDGNSADKNLLNKHYSAQLNRKHYFVPLKKTEIACYISHLLACQEIVHRNLDYGIILEDDVILEKPFKFIHYMLESIEQWDYIKLAALFKEKRIIERNPITFSIPTNCETEKYQSQPKTIPLKQEKLIAPFAFELVRWAKIPIGTQAYAISLKGAKELLSKRSVFFRPIDVDLQFTWETNLDIKGVIPDLCKISDVESTIGTRRAKPHYPLARLVHKIKYAFNSIVK